MQFRFILYLLFTSLISLPSYGQSLEKGLEAFERRDYSTALSEWRPLANKGDPSAQANIGYMYEDGHGVARDYKEALKWYRLAADQGDAFAQVNLGNMYDWGRGVPRDSKEAFKLYRLAADQGDSVGQHNVGFMYDNGLGVLQNFEKAAEWYRLAAEQGYSDAQHNLGVLYEVGNGVSQNYNEAMKWYHLAADQGAALALNALGTMYQKGNGVSQNYNEAMKWYRLAADQGDPDAQFNIGYMYDWGLGVARDYKEALKWYRLAADQGHERGQFSLGDLYREGLGTSQDYSKAIEWFQKSATVEVDLLKATAEYNLGQIYLADDFILQNYDKAMEYFLSAANLGLKEAAATLGSIYSLGEIVPRDDEKALKWHTVAAEKGHSDAQFIVGYFHQKGAGGVPKNIDEALRWFKLSEAQGNHLVMNHLGHMFFVGEQVPRDVERAIEYFENSIEIKMTSTALYHVAYVYKAGIGKEINFEKAADLFEKSLEYDPNHPPANFQLADMYLRGYGVRQDANEAIRLFKKSAVGNYAKAAVKLAEIYEFGIGVEQDQNKKRKWLDKAANSPQEYDWGGIFLGDGSGMALAKAHLRSLKPLVRFEQKKSFVALLIAAENYEHLEDLETPRNDIKEIGTILKDRYGFETTALYDPTRADITKKLNQLKTELKEGDTLLIYYAGHGVEDSGDGFWLPVDAQKEDDTNWLANDYLTRKLRTIKATNILLIADSCYSGTLSRGIKISSSEQNKPASDAIQLFSETKSRVVITSGNLEPVMDGGGGNHSVFARGLLEVLSANSNTITATELYNQTSRIVINDSLSLGKSQTPTIASLNSAGHIGPDVVLYQN